MKNLKNKYSPTPGIEPGSPNREIGILTTRLCEVFLICVWIEINWSNLLRNTRNTEYIPFFMLFTWIHILSLSLFFGLHYVLDRRILFKTSTIVLKHSYESPEVPDCYFTRLNLKEMGPLQFCLSIFQGTQNKKIFLNSCVGFLMEAPTRHSHLSPF